MRRLNHQHNQGTLFSSQGAPPTSSYQEVPQTDSYLSGSNYNTPLTSLPPSSTPSLASARSYPSSQSDCAKQRMGYQHRSDADQRAALFSGYKRQPVVGKPSDETDRHGAQLTADLESQNDELLDSMHTKVLGLKEIALGMRQQVRESNSLLDKMGSAMTAAGGLLGTTMTRLQSLTSYRTGRHIWLMMLFFVGVLFVLYLLFAKRR